MITNPITYIIMALTECSPDRLNPPRSSSPKIAKMKQNDAGSDDEWQGESGGGTDQLGCFFIRKAHVLVAAADLHISSGRVLLWHIGHPHVPGGCLVGQFVQVVTPNCSALDVGPTHTVAEVQHFVVHVVAWGCDWRCRLTSVAYSTFLLIMQ